MLMESSFRRQIFSCFFIPTVKLREHRRVWNVLFYAIAELMK